MSENPMPATGAPPAMTGRKLMRKDERRAQLIRAAAKAFLAGGFAATSLDDVAAEAGVTKMIIYRHFGSKRDLYHAVLVDARERMVGYVGPPEEYGRDTLRTLALAARDNPDGFRLLYRQSAREPEFAGYVEEILATARGNAEAWLRDSIADPGLRAWTAMLLPTIAYDAVLAWLDADQPVSPENLDEMVGSVLQALTRAAVGGAPPPTPRELAAG
jgi:AcrR family transcriptional regulator